MIVLFAPSKTMNEKKSYETIDLLFSDKTEELIKTILSWNKQEFLDAFKINENLYSTVFNYYNNFNKSSTYKSFELYSGVSFKLFSYDTLTEKEVNYLNNNVIVIDSLYGIIYPNSKIRPYRLDFHTKNLNLISFWKKEINNYFSKFKDKEILSLSSKEFCSILSKDKNVVSVKFLNEVNGVKKAISVFNKQMRGLLLRYIIKNEINSIMDLPFEIEGYVKEEVIINKEIIYLKKD